MDVSDSEFKKSYRLTKDLFKFLCEELRLKTNLRSTQRISLELKIEEDFVHFKYILTLYYNLDMMPKIYSSVEKQFCHQSLHDDDSKIAGKNCNAGTSRGVYIERPKLIQECDELNSVN